MFRQTVKPRRPPPPDRARTVDMPDNPDDTMEDFCTEARKGLWHAFNMLKKEDEEPVQISQLKVITSNLGFTMNFEKAEQFLVDEDGTQAMDFQTYYTIVKEKMFDDMEKAGKSYGTVLNDVLKVCWTFCSFSREHETKVLCDEHSRLLWRLFNFLCEVSESGEPLYPIRLHKEEAGFLLREFIETTGQRNKEAAVRTILEGECEFFKFKEFLNLFEKEFIQSLSEADIKLGLNELSNLIILNILKKGMIWKRGHKVKNWKERWLVLSPKELKYFVHQTERELKGTIEFDSECKIELAPDRPGHKPNRMILHTKKKPYEMSAPDLKTKNEWVSAMQLAIDHIGKDVSIQKEEALKRRRARAEATRLAAEDERRRQEEAELMRQKQEELDAERKQRQAELDLERKLREDAEARFQEEQRLRELEQQKLRELEAIKQELERLLAEERQAKEDEAIVRALQAKILEEEFQKREELERLKQQQEELLRAEREQKAVLESDREEQERRFREAQARLEQLERDRTAADEELKKASEKLLKAEKERQIMQDKVQLWKKPTVGLARPLLPEPNPHITHRGLGAFCEGDFSRKPSDSTAAELRLETGQSRAATSGSSDQAGTHSSSATDDVFGAENGKPASPTDVGAHGETSTLVSSAGAGMDSATPSGAARAEGDGNGDVVKVTLSGEPDVIDANTGKQEGDSSAPKPGESVEDDQ